MATMNIQRNARVLAADGEFGRVTHVIVAAGTREVSHIVVDRHGDEYNIPISQVASVEGEQITLHGGMTEIRGASRFDREDFLAVDDDHARQETSRTAERGGAPLIDAAADAVAIDVGETPALTERPIAETRTSDEPYSLRLREERLRTFTERERAGSVRLSTRVVEHEETVTVPLREEHVIVERRPGSGAVSDRTIADGQTVEVEVMRERAAVNKDVVVAEEVGVRKESVQHDERVTETLRREELVVEGDEDLITKHRGER